MSLSHSLILEGPLGVNSVLGHVKSFTLLWELGVGWDPEIWLCLSTVSKTSPWWVLVPLEESGICGLVGPWLSALWLSPVSTPQPLVSLTKWGWTVCSELLRKVMSSGSGRTWDGHPCRDTGGSFVSPLLNPLKRLGVTTIGLPWVVEPEGRVVGERTDLRRPPVSGHKGIFRTSTTRYGEVGGGDGDRSVPSDRNRHGFVLSTGWGSCETPYSMSPRTRLPLLNTEEDVPARSFPHWTYGRCRSCTPLGRRVSRIVSFILTPRSLVSPEEVPGPRLEQPPSG